MKETTSPNKNCESWLGGKAKQNTFHNANLGQNLPTEPHFNHIEKCMTQGRRCDVTQSENQSENYSNQI